MSHLSLALSFMCPYLLFCFLIGLLIDLFPLLWQIIETHFHAIASTLNIVNEL